MIRFLMFIGSLIFLGIVLVWLIVVPDKKRVEAYRNKR
jgi:hypothetical protein